MIKKILKFLKRLGLPMILAIVFALLDLVLVWGVIALTCLQGNPVCAEGFLPAALLHPLAFLGFFVTGRLLPESFFPLHYIIFGLLGVLQYFIIGYIVGKILEAIGKGLRYLKGKFS